jgi:EAL domain-containing protein (putative c-di-GMP-specific phosphodiesterase class I)
MDADLSNRKLLEGALRQAIKNRELHVVYQPIVDRSGGRLVGVEALARWIHPVHIEIPPARFIPIAEHSGLIVELGEYILRRACLDGRNWPGVTVSVNVSPLQFRRPDFVEAIERILGETGFAPNQLELELTESTLLGNLESAELSMLRLKGVGVCFALDDFGTGYSSLLYLRRFPFDKLKIDSSFVRSIEKAADAAAIVRAVVSLGRGLGMKVMAGRRGRRTASVPARRRRAFDARLPLRPASDRGRDRSSPRRARGLPGHQSRSGNRGRELTGCHSGQRPFPVGPGEVG